MKVFNCAIVCVLLLSGVVAQANDRDYVSFDARSVDFAAPVVGSKTQLTDVAAGTIIYEPGTGFWGLSTAGSPSTAANWVQLSAPAGTTAVVSSGSERIERVAVTSACSSSPCTIASQSGSWVSSITWSSTGSYTVNFATSTFSAAPSCNVSSTPGGHGIQISTITSSALSFVMFRTTTELPSNSGFHIICMGPR